MEINKRVMLIGLIVIVVLGCFYYFLLGPQIKAYGKDKEELAGEKVKLEKAQIEVLSLQSENKKLAKTRKEFNKVNKLFLTEMRNGMNVILLGVRTADDNLEINSLEPEKIKEAKYTLEMPLKITAQGDYRNMVDFIKGVENEILNNLAVIKNFKMEATPEPGIIKITMDLSIYSAKTPQGKLFLEELVKRLIGRYNIFRPVPSIAPVPETAGQLKPSATLLEGPGWPLKNKDGQPSSVTGTVYKLFSYSEPALP